MIFGKSEKKKQKELMKKRKAEPEERIFIIGKNDRLILKAPPKMKPDEIQKLAVSIEALRDGRIRSVFVPYDYQVYKLVQQRPMSDKEIIQQLWGLLDDIDTLGDAYKPEQTAYFKHVCTLAKDRFKHIRSDGYRLSYLDGTKLLEETKMDLVDTQQEIEERKLQQEKKKQLSTEDMTDANKQIAKVKDKIVTDK